MKTSKLLHPHIKINQVEAKSLDCNLDERFATTFNSLIYHNNLNKIALAVSGGVDSMALFHLIAFWHNSSAEAKKVEIHILHINHKLRAESELEEEFVKNISLKHGYKFFCSYWDDIKTKSSIQEAARSYRYDQMSKYCRENDIPVILTAHHRNDVIENYIFRKKRGSGPLGLSTSFQSYHNDIRVIRPLSWYYKDDLIQYMNSKGHSWHEDSSNQDTKYSRNLIRHQLSSFDKKEIDNIEHEIQNNDSHCKQIEKQFIKAIAETVNLERYGAGRINLNKFRILKNEIQIPVLSHILTIISGLNQIPRYRNIETILQSINSNKKINHTMHSCRLFQHGDDLHIYKEASKISKDPVILKNKLIWDNRFQFIMDKIQDSDLSSYTVCMFSREDFTLLKKDDNFLDKLHEIDDFAQKKLIFTFPVIKKVEKVVAVPHIFYYDDDNVRGNLKVIFKPRFISRFTHFHNYSKANINE